jgi:hypothetical protein
MPRPRYPSDERRRKTRPHAKIHLSCRSHPRYGHVFEDLESRAVIWGLWLLAVQYFASHTGDEVTLGHGDLTWLTGRQGFGAALARLRRHCDAMAYPVRVEGRRVHVEIRNLERKQGFDSAHGGAPPQDSLRLSPLTPNTSKKGAHAPVKRCSTYRSTPETSEAPDAYEIAYGDALRRLRGAGRTGPISAVEIEAEILRVEGVLPDA